MEQGQPWPVKLCKNRRVQCGCRSDRRPCGLPCLSCIDTFANLLFRWDCSWASAPAWINGESLHLPVQGWRCFWSLARRLCIHTTHQHRERSPAFNIHAGHRDDRSGEACLAEQLVGSLPVWVCGGSRDKPLRCYSHKVIQLNLLLASQDALEVTGVTHSLTE